MAKGPEWAVAKCLGTKGLGTFFQDEIDADRDPGALVGTLIVSGQVAPRPDDMISVLRGIGGRLDSFGVQEDIILEIQCRSAVYETAFDRAAQVSNALHLEQGNIGGIIMRVRAAGPPVSLGLDAGTQRPGRWVTSQTFTVVLKQGENTTP